MEYYQKLLANNRTWVDTKLNEDPEFFNRLVEGQHPPVFQGRLKHLR